MHVISGQDASRLAIHIIDSFSHRVRHRREVRSRPKSNLYQTPVLQAVPPDVPQPVYRTADKHALSWFSPHAVRTIVGYFSQINRLMIGHIYPNNADVRRVMSETSSHQFIAA